MRQHVYFYTFPFIGWQRDICQNEISVKTLTTLSDIWAGITRPVCLTNVGHDNLCCLSVVWTVAPAGLQLRLHCAQCHSPCRFSCNTLVYLVQQGILGVALSCHPSSCTNHGAVLSYFTA